MAVAQLARTLHATTIAEGIERRSDVEALESIGCELGQGFSFAPPLSDAETATFLGIDSGQPEREREITIARAPVASEGYA